MSNTILKKRKTSIKKQITKILIYKLIELKRISSKEELTSKSYT